VFDRGLAKKQGSDEGALRIPDFAQAQQELFQKRFPHRFLPSAGALGSVHATCQSARLDGKRRNLSNSFSAKHLWAGLGYCSTGVAGRPERSAI
jgi:hypothetical protein